MWIFVRFLSKYASWFVVFVCVQFQQVLWISWWVMVRRRAPFFHCLILSFSAIVWPLTSLMRPPQSSNSSWYRYSLFINIYFIMHCSVQFLVSQHSSLYTMYMCLSALFSFTQIFVLTFSLTIMFFKLVTGVTFISYQNDQQKSNQPVIIL